MLLQPYTLPISWSHLARLASKDPTVWYAARMMMVASYTARSVNPDSAGLGHIAIQVGSEPDVMITLT